MMGLTAESDPKKAELAVTRMELHLLQGSLEARMVSVRKSYNSKFILETVKLITSGGASADHVARDFGIHIETLFKWIAQHSAKPEKIFPGKANLTTDAEIIRKLKRENVELRKKLAL